MLIDYCIACCLFGQPFLYLMYIMIQAEKRNNCRVMKTTSVDLV